MGNRNSLSVTGWDGVHKTVKIWVYWPDGGHEVHRVSKNAVEKLQDLDGEKFHGISNAAPEGDEYLCWRRIFTAFDREGHDASIDTYNQPQIYRWLLNQRTKVR